ncbi:hypothetical protein [Legionella sainthelensi]|uniref:hypothetical protein n=1 Tax=Legionella sainthelensi TaxID=28087 RepID=UPI000E1FD02A|nr:hypothetical protein [Legionella sainthelensi]
MKKPLILLAAPLLGFSYQAIAMEYTLLPPAGVCVFDIDGTLTERGSFEAINVCKQLGYGIGINTGENRDSAQVSMNAIYNGVSERGKSLEALHPELGDRYYDFVYGAYNTYHQSTDLIDIIGNGEKTMEHPGDVNRDTLFQYSGGCKENFSHSCTNWPYKHEGLESIAEFYYEDYVRPQDNSGTKGGMSDVKNECIVLFDDQKSTIQNYANNISEGNGSTNLANTTGDYSKLFRGVYIQQPGWTFNSAEEAKATICKSIKALPEKCQVSVETYHKVCGI